MISAPAIEQFTYAFAKDKGVVVLPGRDVLTVGVRAGADPLVLVEARRSLGAAFQLEALDRDSYERTLADVFAFAHQPLCLHVCLLVLHLGVFC